MGYKICTSWGTKFSEVQNSEMGYCTPKWGTVGNPGITLSFRKGNKRRIVSFLSVYISENDYLP
jgi:hypothetical protein